MLKRGDWREKGKTDKLPSLVTDTIKLTHTRTHLHGDPLQQLVMLTAQARGALATSACRNLLLTAQTRA